MISKTKPSIIHAQDIKHGVVDMTYKNIKTGKNDMPKDGIFGGETGISNVVQYMLLIFLTLNVMRMTGIIKTK